MPEWHESQWNNVPARAEAAVFAYTALPDMLPGKIVAVEASYGPSGGYARPDLLIDDGRHARVPLDYKTTLSLGRTKADAERNRARRIAGWADSFQLFHYARLEDVLHYYVGFMVLEPEFSFEVLPFEIHPETMKAWEVGRPPDVAGHGGAGCRGPRAVPGGAALGRVWRVPVQGGLLHLPPRSQADGA